MTKPFRIGTAATLALLAVLAGGCGYLENKGEPRPNIRPKVFITNFPPASESRITRIDTVWDPVTNAIVSIDTAYDFDVVTDTITYLANPRVYWFGTDVDGRVDAFEYAVVPTDSLAPHPAGLPTVRTASGRVDPLRFTDTLDTAPADSLDWIELLPPNIVQNAQVFLFADIDTSVAIDQFLFVRAIDNLGLRSVIKFARYSRQNHPPDTYINLDTIEVIQPNDQSTKVRRSRKYFSLPQSTDTYPGITIGWSGSDSTDFPDEQPPFEFNWVLYGPFPDQASARPDSNFLRTTNDNLATPRVEWTTNDRHTFFNLRSGWYAFEVRARDDAFVSDPTPAVARFQVVEPSFTKDFLVMDASFWGNAALFNSGSYNFREPRNDSLTPDTIRAFYNDIFSGQGYAFNPAEDSWSRQSDECDNCLNILPDRDVLGRYKAVIVFDEDLQFPLDRDNNTKEFENTLSEYMNVGGRVVLIGRNLFGRSVTGWEATTNPTEASFTPADWSLIYFGVTRMYFPNNLKFAKDYRVDSTDFIGTIALDPAFPVVTVDTLLTLKLSQLEIPGLPDRDGDGTKDWLYLPDVNWIAIDRTRGAEGFYQYNSVRPNTSPSQGRICGARYEFFDIVLNRPTFRTEIVTFPLSTLKRDESLRTMVRELLQYILE